MFDVEMRIKHLLLRSCLMLTNMMSENIDLLVVLEKKMLTTLGEDRLDCCVVL